MSGQPILMPKLGLTMTEGMLAEWKVAAGDSVAAGDVLFVVETDKISNEVEAQAAGTITALHAGEGETLPVGAVLGTLVVADGNENEVPAVEAREAKQVGSTAAVAAPAPPVRAQEQRHIVATPLARRMAAKAGLDLARIAGSGPRGRIVADDVAGASGAGTPTTEPYQADSIPDHGVSQSVAFSQPFETDAPMPEQGTRHPLGPYQRVTARRLTEAKRDIPHFYVQADADVTDLLTLRAQLNTDARFARLTVNHFLIAALARTLAAVPAVNRIWAGDHLLEPDTIDVGMAVEAPRGLVAPVLRDLAARSLDEIAIAAGALVERARSGRLTPEDLAGGAIAISNVGMFGVKALIPIVNPGQSSILGIGAPQPAFRPDPAGAPMLRQMLTLTLSCDHRVIDGALAARFLAALAEQLEHPAALLRRPPQDPAR